MKNINIENLPYGKKEMKEAPIGHEFSIIHSITKENVEKRKRYRKISDTECVIVSVYNYS